MLSPGLVVVVQKLSHAWFCVTPWTVALQASLTFTVSQSLLKLMSIESVKPSNHLILCLPFSSCPQSFPASGSFPMNLLTVSGGQSTGPSASASVLPMNIQGWQVWSSCYPRNSQESSPAPQFGSISSSALNLLYGTALTFVHDYWKNNSFD